MEKEHERKCTINSNNNKIMKEQRIEEPKKCRPKDGERKIER